MHYLSQHVLASGDVRLLRYFDLALNRVRSGDQYVLDQVLTMAILTMARLNPEVRRIRIEHGRPSPNPSPNPNTPQKSEEYA